MSNQLVWRPDEIPEEIRAAVNKSVQLWMEKSPLGVWQICAAIPGPRDMTVRFDVPDEIVARIARFTWNGQRGFESEKRIQGNGSFG